MPKQEITDRAVIDELFTTARTGCLGMVDPDGAPYVLPVNFVYTEGRFYVHCATSGRKLDCLAHNPRVTLVCYAIEGWRTGANACEFGVTYKSAIAFGTARLIEDAARRAEVLNALTRKHAHGAHFEPCTAAESERVCVIEITPERVTGKANLPRP